MLRPKPNRPQHEWMVIYTASDILEAQIVAGRLQAEGINALVNYPIGSSAMGIRLGSISVLVRPENYQTAHQILFDEDDETMIELPAGDRDALYDWQDYDISSFDNEGDDKDDDDNRRPE